MTLHSAHLVSCVFVCQQFFRPAGHRLVPTSPAQRRLRSRGNVARTRRASPSACARSPLKRSVIRFLLRLFRFQTNYHSANRISKLGKGFEYGVFRPGLGVRWTVRTAENVYLGATGGLPGVYQESTKRRLAKKGPYPLPHLTGPIFGCRMRSGQYISDLLSRRHGFPTSRARGFFIMEHVWRGGDDVFVPWLLLPSEVSHSRSIRQRRFLFIRSSKKLCFLVPLLVFFSSPPRNSDVSAHCRLSTFIFCTCGVLYALLSLLVRFAASQNARPLHPCTPPRPDYRYCDTRFHDGIHGNDTSSPKGGRRPPVTLHRFAGAERPSTDCVSSPSLSSLWPRFRSPFPPA
jgi:hypothetical protein